MTHRVRVLSGPGLRPGLLVRALLPHRPPFPLDGERASLWHLGRTAIWQALSGLGLGRGDRVLFPAYHCGSEIDPALHLGVAVELYPIGAGLDPDLAALDALAAGARAR
jgi:hypothetical protein